MFKIGEFSKLTQVSVRMLRYYDETGLLKPEKVDRFSGYRLYSAEQIPLLCRIVFLRDMGFNVAEIAVALRSWGGGDIAGLLESKRVEIESNISEEQRKLDKIDLAIRDISEESISIHCSVIIKSIPSYQVLSSRRIIPDYFAEGLLWQEIAEFSKRHGIGVSGESFSIYHDMEFKEHDVDVEVCAVVEKLGKGTNGFVFRVTEAVPIMATTMVYGDFKNIAGAYIALAGWLSEHSQYKICGKDRQIVHRGPWNEDCPDNYLTEIQIPLEKFNGC